MQDPPSSIPKVSSEAFGRGTCFRSLPQAVGPFYILKKTWRTCSHNAGQRLPDGRDLGLSFVATHNQVLVQNRMSAWDFKSEETDTNASGFSTRSRETTYAERGVSE